MGVPSIEIKEMRHSFACACLRTGHSAEEVARWLGHSTTQMVHEHYAHLLNYDETHMFRLLGPADKPAARGTNGWTRPSNWGRRRIYLIRKPQAEAWGFRWSARLDSNHGLRRHQGSILGRWIVAQYDSSI